MLACRRLLPLAIACLNGIGLVPCLQLQIDFLNLRKGVYEDLRPEDEALKVPRRVYEMSLEYRDEVGALLGTAGHSGHCWAAA